LRRCSNLGGVVGLLLLALLRPSAAGEWKPLAEDGVHDPTNPALSLLQEPAEALSQLPPDTAGNKVRWVEALQSGYINPRTNIQPETKIEVLDLDIIMPRTGSAAFVRFPHKPHTEWLDCSNCHDAIFKAKAGATPVDMLQILSGEYCGRCHGAVAFPLTECSRCHSVSPNAQPGAVNK
jgi:c(7)-type cytochrome triheme protein